MPPLHTARSCASSCFSIIFFMSFATHRFQVFLPLSLPLFPSTSIFLHADTQSSVSLRFTCPNHLNLPWRTLSDTLTIPSLSRSSSLEFLSFSVTPHIHLIIMFSVLSNHTTQSARHVGGVRLCQPPYPAPAPASRGRHRRHCARLDPVVPERTHTAGRVRRRAIGYVGGAVRRSTGHSAWTAAVRPLHGSTVQRYCATSDQRSSIR